MKNKETEQMLINNASLEDLINMKIESEFKAELEKSRQKPLRKTYTQISEVPKDLIFSLKAVYRVFNRKTGTETFINGLQAEALTGVQHEVREKLSQGLLSAFAADDAYVKFERVRA